MKQINDYNLPERCMIMAALALPGFMGSAGLSLFLLNESSNFNFLNLRALKPGFSFFASISTLLIIIIFIGWYQAQRNSRGSFLAHLTAQTIVIGYVCTNTLLGTYTTPAGLALMASIGAGFLLLPKFVMQLSCVIAISILILVELLTEFGILSNAAYFTIPPYMDGKLVTFVQFLFAMIYYFSLILIVLVFYYMATLIKQNQDELKILSVTDTLTGIANRREFVNRLDTEWIKASRTKRPTSLVFCDIDFFKQVNDQYGQQVGDNVIIAVAEVIDKCVRNGTDLAARIGGDEFALILAETDAEGAAVVANRVLDAIRKMRFVAQECEFKVTISIGMETIDDYELDASSLIKITDRLLFRAKENGRNQLISGSN